EPQRDARLDELVGPGTGFLRAGRGAGWVLWFGRRRAGLRIAGLRPAGTERTGTEQRTDVERTGAVEAPLDGLPPEEAATLRIRRGAMTRSLSVMPLVRAQSVQLRRPLVHRMIGLASIQVHTVLGPVRME